MDKQKTHVKCSCLCHDNNLGKEVAVGSLGNHQAVCTLLRSPGESLKTKLTYRLMDADVV